jgi:hypothetical protein
MYICLNARQLKFVYQGFLLVGFIQLLFFFRFLFIMASCSDLNRTEYRPVTKVWNSFIWSRKTWWISIQREWVWKENISVFISKKIKWWLWEYWRPSYLTNHSTYINHETNRCNMYHPIFLCLILIYVYKKHQLYALSRSNAHIYIYMMGREEKKETLTIHLSSFLHLSFISYTCICWALMRATEKGGAMARLPNECVRVL